MKIMKKALLTVFISILAIALFALQLQAHSGGLDENGGHYDHANDEYHYHHGHPAHQHKNGVCPYDETTDIEASNDTLIIVILIFIVLILIWIFRKMIVQYWLNILIAIGILILIERIINTSLIYTLKCLIGSAIIFTFIIGFLIGSIADFIVSRIKEKFCLLQANSISFRWPSVIICYVIVFLSNVYAPTFEIMEMVSRNIASIYFLLLIALSAALLGGFIAYIFTTIICKVFKIEEKASDTVFMIACVVFIAIAIFVGIYVCLNNMSLFG